MDGGHLVDLRAKLLFSDFDEVPDERLYVVGDAAALAGLLANDEATDLHGNVSLDASLSVENPVNQLLPEFLREHVEGLLDDQLKWGAQV